MDQQINQQSNQRINLYRVNTYTIGIDTDSLKSFKMKSVYGDNYLMTPCVARMRVTSPEESDNAFVQISWCNDDHRMFVRENPVVMPVHKLQEEYRGEKSGSFLKRFGSGSKKEKKEESVARKLSFEFMRETGEMVDDPYIQITETGAGYSANSFFNPNFLKTVPIEKDFFYFNLFNPGDKGNTYQDKITYAKKFNGYGMLMLNRQGYDALELCEDFMLTLKNGNHRYEFYPESIVCQDATPKGVPLANSIFSFKYRIRDNLTIDLDLQKPVNIDVIRGDYVKRLPIYGFYSLKN